MFPKAGIEIEQTNWIEIAKFFSKRFSKIKWARILLLLYIRGYKFHVGNISKSHLPIY